MRRGLPTEGACELCQRDRRLTFHHLIPATLHSNRWFKKNFTREEMEQGVLLCTDCHAAVHRFISHKDLARDWNTLEKLRAHPDVEKFVGWVSRQQGRSRTAPPSAR